jgi:mono/diheme cytochrome c family protein
MARTTRAGRIAGIVALMAAFAAQGQSRGELLYSTHCIACHSTKMHWRDARAATDWASLVVQVRKWESANSLSWNDQDVVAVARYLNETIYHFDPPQPRADARSRQ